MGCYNQYKARDCSYTECKSQHMLHTLALWGLVTNYGEGGGGYKTVVGASEVLPLQKRGGDTTSFEVVLTWELEVLAIVMGGAQKVSTF